ncbi:DUF2127 domain-containing protein [Aliivibrio salmonicida]|uniref:Membrane protein n=1 Tax=Aliivibrio salmonicida (strain LFI1238) TaxID=316275 RepID=B6EJP1_ALISL|nr:DUF2127 domain-containing protein [Aliivibrio salmonicida]AZL84538.1 DUF2127 domain-containing protein [Aliivibrio salmonicida]CAQ78906.1 membrane protein [Aliivibrio salmonicida LFI1238]
MTFSIRESVELKEVNVTTIKKGLRAVAILEASKGIMSLLVAFGVHALADHNLRHLAELIVSRLHLNPASHLPSVFIDAASGLTDAKIMLFTIGAVVYSIIRLVEAYGLWRAQVWTEWFALVSGAIYIPFELYEIIFRTSILSFGAFIINIIVVGYMAYVILDKKKVTPIS